MTRRRPARPKLTRGKQPTAGQRSSAADLRKQLHKRTRELAEAQKLLAESLQQQTATADVLKVITRSTFNLQAVLDTLVESATQLCEAQDALIFLPSGNVYRAAARYGYSLEYHQFIESSPISIDRGSVVGRAVIDKQIVHITDVLADPEYTRHDAQRMAGYRTALGVPLLREGDVIGVIFLTRIRPQPFTEKQIELVATFADQAVIAIENTRLLKELRARTDDLSESLQEQTATADVLNVISRSPTDAAPVFNIIGGRAEKLCNSEISVVSVLDGDLIRVAGIRGISSYSVELFRAHFPMPLDRMTVTARTIKSGAVVHVSDVLVDPTYDNKILAAETGFRSCLGVPMHLKGKIVGAIFVARTEPGPFSDNQIRLLETFADQAVQSATFDCSKRYRPKLASSRKLSLIRPEAQTS